MEEIIKRRSIMFGFDLSKETSLWLKGDNPNNTNIRWYDASPNNYVLNGSATLIDNVLNGQSGYVFNGSSNYFDGGDILDIRLKSRTIYSIFKGTLLNGYDGIITKATFGTPGLGNWVFRGYLGTYNTIVQDAYGSVITPALLYPNNTFIKTRGIIDRDNSALRCKYLTTENSVIFNYTTDFNNSVKLIIGGIMNATNTSVQSPMRGTICEIITIDRLLTTYEDTYIQNYLNTKYGL